MTAKALLSNGQLRNRVTIIPLNKVCTNLTCMLVEDVHATHHKIILLMHYTVWQMYTVTSGLIELASGAIVFLNKNVEQARKWTIDSQVHHVL